MSFKPRPLTDPAGFAKWEAEQKARGEKAREGRRKAEAAALKEWRTAQARLHTTPPPPPPTPVAFNRDQLRAAAAARVAKVKKEAAEWREARGLPEPSADPAPVSDKGRAKAIKEWRAKQKRLRQEMRSRVDQYNAATATKRR